MMLTHLEATDYVGNAGERGATTLNEINDHIHSFSSPLDQRLLEYRTITLSFEHFLFFTTNDTLFSEAQKRECLLT